MVPTIDKLIISGNLHLRDAIYKINENAQGIVFVVDDDHKLCGILTDGDIRRALLHGQTLDVSVRETMNKNFIVRPVDTPNEELTKLLTDKIRHIPLIDSEGRPVDYACRQRLHTIPVMEPFLGGNELAYVIDCIKSNWISSQGKYVHTFEEKFAELLDGGTALAVSNGTVALHLALETLGIGPSDEVIVPDLTFAASVNAIIYTGATPVLVDVSRTTWNIDPAGLTKAITPKTKAIMVVHLYGHPADMDPISEVARRNNLLVIEDCAEALGAKYNGNPVGLIGDAGCFSFFGNKMITTGEGGMVVFKDRKYAEHAAILRDHGMSREKRYWHTEVGFNYRMTNLQAAVGVAQLEQFDSILRKKTDIAKIYKEAFTGCPGITLPPQEAWAMNVFWLYTILVDENVHGKRDDLIRKFLLNGIETRPVFYPIHKMPPYVKFTGNSAFPNSEGISRMGISLPSSITASRGDIEFVVDTLNKLLQMRGIAG